MSANDSIAANLKRYREKENLTQERLSELAGCSKNHLSALERGKKFPSAALIDKFCEILNVKTYELFMDNTDIEELKKQKNFIEYVMDSLDKNRLQ